MAGMTKAQRDLLQMASDLGCEIHVHPDQRRDVARLEHLGLMKWNGNYFNRKSTITPAGRAALAGEEK